MKYNSTENRKGTKSFDPSYKQPTGVSVSVPDAGYPQTGVKTSGIKIRGTGAAIKGVKARGPMG